MKTFRKNSIETVLGDHAQIEIEHHFAAKNPPDLMKNQKQEFMFRQQIPDSDTNSQYKTLTFQVHFQYSEVPSSTQTHGYHS